MIRSEVRYYSRLCVTFQELAGKNLASFQALFGLDHQELLLRQGIAACQRGDDFADAADPGRVTAEEKRDIGA
ncbi:hypothetical protein SDC9_144618 [bioreactor metagenome]|uniref:Uncharacterized protein n=1 Tax=bioreactor metagenome TaxID=1076179 RepID=A0A645E7I1_9ZZZZ